MTINKQYFDIFINEHAHSFYISPLNTSKRPSHFGLITMEKIERVLAEGFKYDSSQVGEDSELSQQALFSLLQKKATDIHTKYTQKQLKLGWIRRKIFSKEKRLCAIHDKVETHISRVISSRLPSLPKELMEIILTTNVTSKELVRFAQVSKTTKTDSKDIFLKQARELGYVGTDYAEASEYFRKLLKDIDALAKEGVIPQSHLRYKGSNRSKNCLDASQILQSIRNGISSEDAFLILSNPTTYIPSYSHFRKIFNKRLKIRIIDSSGDDTRSNKDTALILSAVYGAKNIVELALQHGACINTRYKPSGDTPLHCAVWRGHTEIVRLLIEQGADVNTTTFHGNVPLIESRSTEITEILLQAGAAKTINFCSSRTSKRIGSPLHCAAREGNLPSVKLLLSYGADMESKDCDGCTPLIAAIQAGKMEIVEYLIMHYRNKDRARIDLWKADVNAIDNMGKTPLIYFILHLATIPKGLIFRKMMKTFRLLLDEGATMEMDHCSYDSGTALHCAVKNCLVTVVELLLQYGADLHIRDHSNFAAFSYCRYNSEEAKEIFNLMLKKLLHDRSR
jgi:ankyrin repeat protein